ncbi:nucleotidyl transferase AbiEii/AbiGii toxin family protein [Thermodesulfobacteriota bacterium]
MTQKHLKNIAASVRQRLLNKSRTDARPFQELVQYYAMERFLYRLSKSQHANRFILKGALLLKVWQIPGNRSTMDIDLLGKTHNDVSLLISNMADILSVNIEPDGLSFFPENITAERITEDSEYKGIRISFPANLDKMSLNMQIDIGFGDIIYPGSEKSEMPVMLEFPVPLLVCYSRESVISEKFEAMLKLREMNSRMKDFYDIWLLSRHFEFEGKILAEAVKLTLKQRGTEFPDKIIAFSQEFITTKQIQWNAFRKKLKQDHIPTNFDDIVTQVRKFIDPIASALISQKPPPSKWFAPGPWM